jgi:hypothetical protein
MWNLFSAKSRKSGNTKQWQGSSNCIISHTFFTLILRFASSCWRLWVWNKYKSTNCLLCHLDQNSLGKVSTVWIHIPLLLWFCDLYPLLLNWVSETNTNEELFATFFARMVLGKSQLHDFTYHFYFISTLCILSLQSVSLKQIHTHERIVFYFLELNSVRSVSIAWSCTPLLL